MACTNISTEIFWIIQNNQISTSWVSSSLENQRHESLKECWWNFFCLFKTEPSTAKLQRTIRKLK